VTVTGHTCLLRGRKEERLGRSHDPSRPCEIVGRILHRQSDVQVRQSFLAARTDAEGLCGRSGLSGSGRACPSDRQLRLGAWSNAHYPLWAAYFRRME
jgi:hypothetical protein